MSFDIVLKHVGGERKTVPVEYVSPNLTYLTIRWDLAGLYDLNLAVNVLTPRSVVGQSKGKAKWYKKDKPQWKAEDIAAVRKMASDYVNAKRGNPQDAAAAAMKRHAETMPTAIKLQKNSTYGKRAMVVEEIVKPPGRYAGSFEHFTQPLEELTPTLFADVEPPTEIVKTTNWSDDERAEMAELRQFNALGYAHPVTHAKMPDGEVIPIRGLVVNFSGPSSFEPFPKYEGDPDTDD